MAAISGLQEIVWEWLLEIMRLKSIHVLIIHIIWIPNYSLKIALPTVVSGDNQRRPRPSDTQDERKGNKP